jgi:hypothetical protein
MVAFTCGLIAHAHLTQTDIPENAATILLWILPVTVAGYFLSGEPGEKGDKNE